MKLCEKNPTQIEWTIGKNPIKIIWKLFRNWSFKKERLKNRDKVGESNREENYGDKRWKRERFGSF